MVCFLSKMNDSAVIRMICGDQSKMKAAVNGGDFINLDAIVNDVNTDNNIKHIGALITYCDDEEKISHKLTEINNITNGILQNNISKKKSNNSNEQEKESEIREKISDIDNWKCPDCGGNDCLKDKDGNKYPCLSCLQIDIAQRVLKKFTDKINKSLTINTEIIDSFVKYLKKGKEEYDNGTSN